MSMVGYFEYFSGKSKLFLMTFGLGLDLLVGIVDYLTGYKIRMEVFYLMPIAFMVWFFGKKAGIIMSMVALATSILADALYGRIYRNFFIASWNTVTHFAFFIVVTLLLSRLRIYVQERTDLIFKLQNALGDVKELGGILPICASCKRIRNDEGYWQHVEEYLRGHTNAEFSHGLCTECSMKLYPKLHKKLNDKGDIQR
jgi:hypothetical protein